MPNPSFEDTVLCPHFANQVDRAVGWYPSRESPDYFNECDWATGSQAIPNNFNGFQYAHTGSAYCGFIGYSRNGLNYREDFTCLLTSSLVIGQKYNLSFFISKADKYYLFACNKIGMLFSTNNYNMTNNAPLSNFCQFHTDSIITDTLNWVQIAGSFIADSNYSYLTIGNFFVDSLTDSTYYLPGAAHAYYFIDDISVSPDTSSSLNGMESENGMTVYPIPTHDKIKIKSGFNRVFTAEILSIDGKTLLLFNINQRNREEVLDISALSSGIYFLKLFFNENSSTYYKLLKN